SGADDMGHSVMLPSGVMRPIFRPRVSVNQRLPSGPAVMSLSPLLAVGTAYSTMGGGAGVAANAAPMDPISMTLARMGPRRDWPDSLIISTSGLTARYSASTDT